MKKVLCVVLFLAVLCASCASAETFSAGSAYEARMKALDLLELCGFEAEYPGEGMEQGHLLRWADSIHVYIDGNPGYEDRVTLSDFLMELALRVPGLPNITITGNRSAANMVIYYGPLDQLSAHITDYQPGNWGMTHWWFNGRYELFNAEIVIATDVTTQEARNHLVQEEIFNSLGLLNDHMVYSDSIVYQEWTTVQHPSEVDWIMLNIIYSPLSWPGMRPQEMRRVFTEAWSK